MTEDNEEVEVVYSMESITKAILLICLGAYIGFTCGLGSFFARLEMVARQGHAVIDGDVTIKLNGKPVNISNMNVKVTRAIRIY